MQFRDYLRHRSEYRKMPVPVVLRIKIVPFDRFLLGIGEIGMAKSTEDGKMYLVNIPAYKFLHISMLLPDVSNDQRAGESGAR